MRPRIFRFLFVFCALAIVSSLSLTQAQHAQALVYDNFEAGIDQWNIYPGGSGAGEASISSGRVGDTALHIDYTFPDNTAYLDTTRWSWGGEDWSNTSQLQFWMYGTASGHTHSVQIHDNGNELFDVTFVDDFEGWQQQRFFWENFTRSSWQPDDTPNDGLTLTEVTGLTFRIRANSESAGSYKLDQIEVNEENAPIPAPKPNDPPSDDEWTLVWSDEFDGTSIDTSKWNVLDTPGMINNELHYIAPDDVYIEDGNLVIRSQERDYGGRSYTSGKVTTGSGKYDFTYGRVEIRSKQPAGKGLHAAHWLLQHECAGFDPCVTWPPEFDILEVLGDQTTTVHQNVHYGTCYHCRWPDNASSPKSTTVSDTSQNYHTYAIEWEPDEVRWYIDDVQTHTWNGPNISDEPMQIILDTAVGGDWPGAPDDSTVFPAYHYIDYVRVWQRNGDTPDPQPTPEPTPTPAPDPGNPQPIGPDGEWTLTFEDEFDTLDTDVWHTMWGLPGAYWDHVQWSDEIMKHDNVWAEDGNLVVRHQVRDGEITSGVVTTRERFTQRHGYFEARMQMCQTQGVLNAFWMQRSPDFWPPEIDIVEILGKEITRPFTTIHYGYPEHLNAGFNEITTVNYASDFHTFGVEWNTDELIWYIDGEEYWRVDNPGGNFDAHEMYMQFNMHSGNGWSGQPDMNDTKPCYMKVDHVRAWQRP
ncbi:MAG: family 16 glycosylhydrolase [Chloroflexota bacterium]